MSFSRQNLSYSERCFAEKFEEHLTSNVACTCDDIIDIARSLHGRGRRRRIVATPRACVVRSQDLSLVLQML